MTRSEHPADAIAIVGMSCRLPGARNLDEYWRLLCEGRDALTEFTESEMLDAGIPREIFANPAYVRAGMILDDVESFDAALFGVSAGEAAILDPQQRLLLECGWEALEAAGHVRGSDARVAVYAGSRASEYLPLPDLFGHGGGSAAEGFRRLTANDKDYIATRLAYALDLRGPAVTLQTACSTSLVAVHFACQSLLNGECDLALAGGVSVRVPQRGGYQFNEGLVFSPDGRTRPFDARANGTTFSSGAGVVALRRLEDALRDRQTIFAVVRGSAVNNDGSGPKAGFTAPSLHGQVRVIGEALAVAGVEPESVTYIEAHGTATAVGDPAEIAALTEVFRDADTPRAIGSVKGNIGHLVQAAGVASIIKTALMLHHGTLVPSINFSEPSPLIDFSRVPFAVNTTLRPWERNGVARRAGVSSFGFGGTNAHVVLEEAPRVEASATPAHTEVLPLSAATEPALRELANRYADFLTNGVSLADVCYSAQIGRSTLPWRLAVAGRSSEEIAGQLRSAPARETTNEPRIGFLFTGQGSQYAGMGRGLYERYPLYRQTFDRCAAILGMPLHELLDDEAQLARTDNAQSALVAMAISTVTLLRSWGIEPTVVLGHSLGEIAAAWAAGLLSTEDALAFAATRGRLMQGTAPGAMATVFGNYAAGNVAAHNGPGQTVISGTHEEIREQVESLARRGITAKLMATPFAFHSALMDPILDELEAAAAKIAWLPAQRSFISTLTGKQEEGTIDWRRQAREPVRFADAVAEAMRRCDVLVEIGPDAVLTGLTRLANPEFVVAPVMKKGDGDQLMRVIATLFTAGATIDWRSMRADEQQARRIPLPSYPFQRKRYWIDSKSERKTIVSTSRAHPLLGARIPSPLETVQFQSEITADLAPFTRGHWIQGVRPLVFVGHMEIVRAAAAELLRNGAAVAEHIVVEQPLLLDENPRRIQTIVKGDQVEIFSAAANDDVWERHTTARITTTAATQTRIDLDAIRARCPQHVTPDDLYGRKRARGAGGPEMDVVERAWRGDGELLAEVAVSDGLASAYGAHPGVLDAVPQCAEMAVEGFDEADLFLPTIAERVVFHDRVPERAFIHVRRREDSGDEVIGIDCTVADAGGRVLVEITGLFLKRARPGSLQGNSLDRYLYNIEWIPIDRPQTKFASGRWIVVGDASAQALAQALRTNGGTAVIAKNADDLRKALAVPAAGVMHGIDDGADRCCSALEIVRVLAELDAPPPLWIVTRGAQFTQRETAPLTPSQSPLWGFGRVVRGELPTLQLRLIDVDPSQETLKDLAAAMAVEGESEVAMRGGVAYVPRLRRMRAPASTTSPYRLEPSRERTIDSLRTTPMTRKQPGPRQVEIEIYASGINFRDILNVTGRLDGAFGFECSGVVVATGRGVTRLKPGMAVMAIAPDSFASHVIADERSVVEKPPGLSFSAAAAAMIAYATAWHGLIEKAQLRAGETVLIHTAAGGVGQAAIQIARMVGATILATSSRGKRDLVLASGAKHVMDSREHGFAARARELTNNQGVDVLLNTLGGDFAQENVAALRAGGRFVELGHPGIHDLSVPQAAVEKLGGTFINFHVAHDVGLHDPEQMQRMLEALAAMLDDGRLRPITHRSFPLADARTAFETMLRGAHIGKLVIVHPAAERVPFEVRPDATYLITGGTGAVGLHIARQLVASGARSLALVSRRGASSQAENEIDAIRAEGCTVRLLEADVTNHDSLSRALATLADAPPLRAIVHAAGVIDDGVVTQQSWERFESVLAPKIDGALHLDRLTANTPLDFFVMISSASTLWGNAGQASYAAANLFVDQFAAARRQKGLPAISIAYGAWSGGGMATTIGEVAQRRRAEHGHGSLDPQVATGALAAGVAADRGHFAVIDIDWQKFVRTYAGPLPPLFTDVVPAVRAATESPLDERPQGPLTLQSVIEVMRKQVALLTGGTDDIAIDRPVVDLGLDSLTMLLLRGRLVTILGEPGALPVVRFLEGNTIEGLAEMIASRVPLKKETKRFQSLTEMSLGNGAPPFFLVPPAGRSVFPFMRLGRELGADRSVYGLNPLGLDGGDPHSSIEEMASHYVREMREAHPNGPYIVAGMCVGAYVALEMAQQLRRAGEEVPLLAVVDYGGPLVKPLEASAIEMMKFYFKQFSFHVRRRSLQRSAVERLRIMLATRWQAMEHLVTTDEPEKIGQVAEVLNAHSIAATRYRASRYPGDVLVVLSQESVVERQERWKLIVDGKVDALVFPDATHDELLSEAFAPRLASELSARFRSLGM